MIEYLYKRGVFPKLITRGNTVIYSQVKFPKSLVIMKDSFQLIPMALSEMPQAFQLPSTKGHFPHYFTCRKNFGLVQRGLPDIAEYGYKWMSVKKAKELKEWYDEQPKDVVFNFDEEILKYCKQDVTVLTNALRVFRRHIIDLVSWDPLIQCSTLPGLTMLIMKTMFLKEKQMVYIDEQGYHLNRQFSDKAIRWLEWLRHKNGWDIRHAYSAKGEKCIYGPSRRYYVDGWVEETKTPIEYLGCFFHGHYHFNASDFNKKLNKTFGQIRTKTNERLDSFLSLVQYNRMQHTNLHQQNKGYCMLVNEPCWSTIRHRHLDFHPF